MVQEFSADILACGVRLGYVDRGAAGVEADATSRGSLEKRFSCESPVQDCGGFGLGGFSAAAHLLLQRRQPAQICGGAVRIRICASDDQPIVDIEFGQLTLWEAQLSVEGFGQSLVVLGQTNDRIAVGVDLLLQTLGYTRVLLQHLDSPVQFVITFSTRSTLCTDRTRQPGVSRCSGLSFCRDRSGVLIDQRNNFGLGSTDQELEIGKCRAAIANLRHPKIGDIPNFTCSQNWIGSRPVIRCVPADLDADGHSSYALNVF